MSVSSFNIYDASAGSGKTYTLVKAYLKILFSSRFTSVYKHILAITFTNKAVGEMKERIIESLKSFSSEDILKNPNSLFSDICIELNISPETLQRKASVLLQDIMHNYASFDISTIDRFTQKIIRTFAFDLQLPLNFEVELDTQSLLNEAVENVIARSGTDPELTEVLIEFALEKTDDDKSWDITFDLNSIASLLTNENHIYYIKQLKNKELKDFKTLKSALKSQVSKNKVSIITKATEVLELVQNSGISHDSFSRGYLPKFFINLQNKKFNVSLEAAWQKDLIEGNTLYPKKVNDATAQLIDEIQPTIAQTFQDIKTQIASLSFCLNFINNLTPLSLLNEIQKEVDLIKAHNRLIPISEFNSIISNHLKEQPAAFIYERIGEKFKHYFIDEFQDTSVMQWENLIPLINNALSGENASTMLVGDAKQAIYRWRGGKAEQFIGLCNADNPFFIEKTLNRLPTNFRSYKQIVEFNNTFFNHIASFTFSDKSYKSLYENAYQKTFIEHEGYVNLSFLELSNDDDKDELYSQKTYETIIDCLQLGYALEDICVLVRKKKEGVAIANYLTEKDIDIMSSETLLLDNSPYVQFIISTLTFIHQPNNYDAKLNMLNYLVSVLNIKNRHAFFNTYIHLNLSEFFEALHAYGISFNPIKAIQFSIYETVEYIIHHFKLNHNSNAYLQFFLDVVLDYSSRYNSNLQEFLAYYELKKETLTIISPENMNAVKIMTIHKSKGLEFPVVIFPFADLDIYREKSPRVWLPVDKEHYNGFEHAYLNFNQNIASLNTNGAQVYQEHNAQLELDNINLLYVALTRPIEQLYIISQKSFDRKGNENLKNYSGLFINYLKHQQQWNDQTNTYSFGNNTKKYKHLKLEKHTQKQEAFISIPKENHHINILANSGYLWDTSQEEAIEKGNLIHNIMASIKTSFDVDIALEHALSTGMINTSQHQILASKIKSIVTHPQLQEYYNTNNAIYNEQDIITQNGQLLRPDRIVVSDSQEVTIIDYKTGVHNATHKLQLEQYTSALNDMGLNVKKRLLIYINDELEVKEV